MATPEPAELAKDKVHGANMRRVPATGTPPSSPPPPRFEGGGGARESMADGGRDRVCPVMKARRSDPRSRIFRRRASRALSAAIPPLSLLGPLNGILSSPPRFPCRLSRVSRLRKWGKGINVTVGPNVFRHGGDSSTDTRPPGTARPGRV